MGLDYNEVGYFISQVGLAASSFGVTDADVATVAATLGSVFNVACAPAVALVNNDTEFQSICVAKDCPLAPGAVCASYPDGGYEPEPMSSGNAGCPAQGGNGGYGNGNGNGNGQGNGQWSDNSQGGSGGSGRKGGKVGGACPAKRKHK
jgi:hypothetical protein